MMTKRERVQAAIAHRNPDRVPKGELLIEPKLIERLLADQNTKGMSDLAKEIAVRELLGIDLINIHEYPTRLIGYNAKGFPIYRGAYGEEFADNGVGTQLLKPGIAEIEDVPDYQTPDISLCTTTRMDYFLAHSDLYVMTQINGPVGALDWMLGMEDYCTYCMTDTELVAELAGKVMDFEIARARKFIDHGADAILVADDIAFNMGLILPPHIMDVVAYPLYKRIIAEIKQYKNVPVILHTDGNINAAMDQIVACGFDGLQSLQPSANMDIAAIKKKYGDKLCLMGNLDLNQLMPFGTPEEVAQETKRLIAACNRDGGFILSTCNILTDMVPPANALAMYRTAEEV